MYTSVGIIGMGWVGARVAIALLHAAATGHRRALPQVTARHLHGVRRGTLVSVAHGA